MGYGGLIEREVLIWAAVSFTNKLPIAMTPLALVFLVRERPNGYAFGAALAACYVVGEVLGSAIQGMWLHHSRIRLQLAIGLAVGRWRSVRSPCPRTLRAWCSSRSRSWRARDRRQARVDCARC